MKIILNFKTIQKIKRKKLLEKFIYLSAYILKRYFYSDIFRF
jgi:hypothetical protein